MVAVLFIFFYPLRNHTIIHFGANYRYSSNNKTQTLYHTDCYLFSQELNFVNTGTGLYRGILNFAICPLVSENHVFLGSSWISQFFENRENRKIRAN